MAFHTAKAFQESFYILFSEMLRDFVAEYLDFA